MKMDVPAPKMDTAWAKAKKCPGDHPRGKGGKHYIARVAPGKWYDEARARGFTRVCLDCGQGDDTVMCSATVLGNWTSNACDNVAKAMRLVNGLRLAREGEKGDWKPFCGVHDPQKAADRQDAWQKQHDHNWAVMQKRSSIQSAGSGVVGAAKLWREFHFTDAPCPPEEGCEHLDCALARGVDRLLGLEQELVALATEA